MCVCVSVSVCVCVPGSSALRSLPGDFDECSSLTTTRLEAEGEGAGNAEGRGGAKSTGRQSGLCERSVCLSLSKVMPD